MVAAHGQVIATLPTSDPVIVAPRQEDVSFDRHSPQSRRLFRPVRDFQPIQPHLLIRPGGIRPQRSVSATNGITDTVRRRRLFDQKEVDLLARPAAVDFPLGRGHVADGGIRPVEPDALYALRLARRSHPAVRILLLAALRQIQAQRDDVGRREGAGGAGNGDPRVDAAHRVAEMGQGLAGPWCRRVQRGHVGVRCEGGGGEGLVEHEEVRRVAEGAVASPFVEAGDGDPFGYVLAVVPLLVAQHVLWVDVGPKGHESDAVVRVGCGHDLELWR